MFKSYRKKALTNIRPFVPGEDTTGISITEGVTPDADGFVAQDPNNPTDQWYISGEYKAANYVYVDVTAGEAQA